MTWVLLALGGAIALKAILEWRRWQRLRRFARNMYDARIPKWPHQCEAHHWRMLENVAAADAEIKRLLQ